MPVVLMASASDDGERCPCPILLAGAPVAVPWCLGARMSAEVTSEYDT